MKKLIYIVGLLLITTTCFSQSIVPRANSSYTVQDSRFKAALNLFVPAYADTTAANAGTAEGIDSLGAIIYTYDVQALWVRRYDSGKKWAAIGGGGGGSGTVTNIATGLGLSGGPITTTGTILVDTASASILSRQRAALTYAPISINGTVTSVATTNGLGVSSSVATATTTPNITIAVDTANASILSRQRAAATYALIGAVANPFLPVSGTGTATGNVIGELSGNSINIQNGAVDWFKLTTTATGERALLAALSSEEPGGTADLELSSGSDVGYQFDLRSFSHSNLVNIRGDSEDNTMYFNSGEFIFTDDVGAITPPTMLLQVQSDNIDYLFVNPTLGQSRIQGYNTTGDGNYGRFTGTADATTASFDVRANFNDGVENAQITGSVDASASAITYTADSHTFTGNILPTTDDTYTLGDDTHRWSDVFVGPASVHIGTSTSDEGLLSYNTSTNVLSVGSTGTLSLTAATTLTGNFLTATDNTYDIGSSSAAFQDIYGRVINLDGSTSGSVTIQSDALANAINGTTLSGTGYVPVYMFAMQAAANSLSDVNTVQAVFASGFDVFTLQASTSYYFQGMYSFSHGATAHSLGMSFELAGGASVTSIAYTTTAWATAANTQTASQTTNLITQTTNTAVNASGSNAVEQVYFQGVIRMNAGGTITPSITFSVAPGGAPQTNINSYIKFTPIGTNTVTSIGNVN